MERSQTPDRSLGETSGGTLGRVSDKRSRRDEIEFLRAKIASVNKSFVELQKFLVDNTRRNNEPPAENVEAYSTARGNTSQFNNTLQWQTVNVDQESVTTIYHDAVQKRGSSSSEDIMINTSDEFSPPNRQGHDNPVRQLQEKFNMIVDNVAGKDVQRRSGSRSADFEEGEVEDDRGQQQEPTLQQLARNHADNLIKEAEASKARIM